MIVLSALKILLTILLVFAIFNLMIIVHELGHFLAAKWRGLVIDEFGIWFGKAIWKKKIKGVWYSLGTIPAGGFVKLPQMAPMEAVEGKSDTPRDELPPISVADKIIVAFAGPLFSFLLAFAFAVLVWQVGRPVSESEATTTIGYVLQDSPAAAVGLQPGDQILSIDGNEVHRWGGMGKDSVTWRIVSSEGETVNMQVKRGDQTLTLNPKPEVPKTEFWKRKALRQLAIVPKDTPVIGEVEAGTLAAQAGARPKDRLVAVDGQKIYSTLGLAEYLSKRPPTEPVRFTVQRGEQTIELPPILPKEGIVAGVIKGSPAAAAGVKPDDIVRTINGQPFVSAAKFVETIRQNGVKPLTLGLVREGKPLQVSLTPLLAEVGEDEKAKESVPRIGVSLEDYFGWTLDARGLTSLSYPTPVDQIKKAGMSIFETVGAIASKKSNVKLQHMSGPVMMMRAYYSFFQVEDGWRLALWFSVVLNVNLALLNMLPIPVLDGGHITLAIVEGIRRRPVNVRILEVVQTGCAMVIIGFMLYIFFFDIQDLFTGGEKRMKFRAPAATPTPAASATPAAQQ